MIGSNWQADIWQRQGKKHTRNTPMRSYSLTVCLSRPGVPTKKYRIGRPEKTWGWWCTVLPDNQRPCLWPPLGPNWQWVELVRQRVLRLLGGPVLVLDTPVQTRCLPDCQVCPVSFSSRIQGLIAYSGSEAEKLTLPAKVIHENNRVSPFRLRSLFL